MNLPSLPLLTGQIERSLFRPSGDPRTDLTNAAYVLFSGLAITGTYMAVKYGERAIKSVAKSMNAEGTRIATGVISKLSRNVQRGFGLNEFDLDSREQTLTAAISEWIREDKEDLTIASVLRAFEKLDERVSAKDLLAEHFNARKLSLERDEKEQPTAQRVFSKYETVTALLLSPATPQRERDRFYAAMVTRLPEPGGTISPEESALFMALEAGHARLQPGLRLLYPGKEQNRIRLLKGVNALIETGQPVHRVYKRDLPRSEMSFARDLAPLVQVEHSVVIINTEAKVSDLSPGSTSSEDALRAIQGAKELCDTSPHIMPEMD